MMRVTNNGNLPLRIEALTDSYSIFSYLAAQHLKLPVEQGTFYHLACLREKFATVVISSYSWTDTRDMAADGLTKGSADRSALAAIMDGIVCPAARTCISRFEPLAKRNFWPRLPHTNEQPCWLRL